GVPRGYFFDNDELNPEAREPVEQALDTLRQAGASVRDIELPHAAMARTVQRVIMLGEAYAYHQFDLASQPEKYGKYTRRQLLQGGLYSAADYIQAQRVRSIVKAEVAEAMLDLDV